MKGEGARIGEMHAHAGSTGERTRELPLDQIWNAVLIRARQADRPHAACRGLCVLTITDAGVEENVVRSNPSSSLMSVCLCDAQRILRSVISERGSWRAHWPWVVCVFSPLQWLGRFVDN